MKMQMYVQLKEKEEQQEQEHLIKINIDFLDIGGGGGGFVFWAEWLVKEALPQQDFDSSLLFFHILLPYLFVECLNNCLLIAIIVCIYLYVVQTNRI
jgi:hypothetical protein